MCKVCTEYHGTREIDHGLCACTVDNPLAKARGLSLSTGAQTMLYLSHFQLWYKILRQYRSTIDPAFRDINTTVGLRNSYAMVCPPVRGDNPRTLVSGLSPVQADKP